MKFKRTIGGILIGLLSFVVITIATTWMLEKIIGATSDNSVDIWDLVPGCFGIALGSVGMFMAIRKYLRWRSGSLILRKNCTSPQTLT